MIIEVFGKQNCELCESAKKKIGVLLDRWDMADQVQVVFQDMDTAEGGAEGDFYDVFEIPTVLVKDGSEVVGRWEDKKGPPSGELKEILMGRQAA